MPQGQQQRGGDRFENYVPVAERVEKFYQAYPTGRINTAILEHNEETGFVLMKAEAFRTPDDAQPSATGHAFEVRSEGYVNKTSYIENAETSSVGRALALLGFEVRRGIASREEMEKANRQQQPASVTPIQPRSEDEDETAKRRRVLNSQIKDLWINLKQTKHPDLVNCPNPREYVRLRFGVENGSEGLNLAQLETLKSEFELMLETTKVGEA